MKGVGGVVGFVWMCFVCVCMGGEGMICATAHPDELQLDALVHRGVVAAHLLSCGGGGLGGFILGREGVEGEREKRMGQGNEREDDPVQPFLRTLKSVPTMSEAE